MQIIAGLFNIIQTTNYHQLSTKAAMPPKSKAGPKQKDPEREHTPLFLTLTH